MSDNDVLPVRCTGWMDEWEAALAQLRKAGEATPGDELTEDQWLRIADAMWIMEEAIAAGRRHSPIDPKLRDSGGTA